MKRILLALTLFGSSYLSAQAPLASYYMNGFGGLGDPAATIHNQYVQAQDLSWFTPGSAEINGAGYAYSGLNPSDMAFQVENVNSSLVAASNYLEITVTPMNGTLDLDELTFNYRRDANGAQRIRIRSSADNFMVDLAPQYYNAVSTTWNTVSFALPSYYNSVSTPVTFRLIFEKFTGTINKSRIDNIDIIGSAIPLPVNLISFSGETQDRTVTLHWATASEKDNSHFVVERSRDGLRFIGIGKVAGNGTTDLFTEYTLEDADALPGINYYRLKQVDFDGTTSYSKVIATRVVGKSRNLSVLPTYAANQVNVLSSQPFDEGTQVQVISLSGQLMTTMTAAEGDFDLNINTEGWAAGMYYITVHTGQEIQTVSMMKSE